LFRNEIAVQPRLEVFSDINGNALGLRKSGGGYFCWKNETDGGGERRRWLKCTSFCREV